MPLDPHASGDVGFLLGVLWLAFAAWLRRLGVRTVSPTEEVAFSVATYLIALAAALLVFFLYGMLVFASLYFVGPVLKGAIGTDFRDVIRQYFVANGPFKSALVIGVLGTIPACLGALHTRWQSRSRRLASSSNGPSK